MADGFAGDVELGVISIAVEVVAYNVARGERGYSLQEENLRPPLL